MVSFTAQRAWDFTLTIGTTVLNLICARKENGEIDFRVDSAPTVSDRIDTQAEESYSSVSPRQGKAQPLVSVIKGAGKKDWELGHYAFGESIETEDGIVRPGPLAVVTTVNGAANLDGAIAAHTLHNDGKIYIAAGRRIYYWDHSNQRYQIVSDPAVDQTMTDLVSFQGVLYAFYGTANNMRYSADNGTTWNDVPSFTTSSGSAASYGCVREQRNTRPMLLVVVQPDLVFQAEDPLDLTSWDTGSRIGGLHANDVLVKAGQEASTLDAFTSVTSAPDGTILFGKKFGWRTMDSFGNVDIVYPATWLSAGQGKDNFYRPVVGPKKNLYTVLHDYDIVEYADTNISPGYGPRAFGAGVTEMEKAIVAIAGDGIERLFVALAGTEGYVMKGVYGKEDGLWHYHGAYVKIGLTITYMYTAIDPQDTQLYLWIGTSLTPWLPYRVLLPRENLDSDSSARFAASGNIRYGYHDNGFADDNKVAIQAKPITRNLLAGTRTLELQYRKDADTSFTSIGTYTDSPEPADLTDTYFPADVTGKRFELKALYTNSSSTGQVIIDRIIARYLTRHIRTNVITATVVASKGQLTRMGARSDVSGTGLRDALEDMREDVRLALLTDQDGRTWTVSIEQITEIELKKSDYAFRLVMLEIPSIAAPGDVEGGSGGGTTVVCIPGGLIAFAGMVESVVQDQEDISFAGMTAAATVA